MTPTITAHGPEYLAEPDRATVIANGIVVDVIANEDGSVYVEVYAYDGRKSQAVVSEAYIDAPHPSFRLTLADRPEVTAAQEAGLL